jgi:hypothetical protein
MVSPKHFYVSTILAGDNAGIERSDPAVVASIDDTGITIGVKHERPRLCAADLALEFTKELVRIAGKLLRCDDNFCHAPLADREKFAKWLQRVNRDSLRHERQKVGTAGP